ncbi:MAG: transcription elongation factor subunit Spt4 [Thermofilum sp.]|uniref:Transcription elongation factor Spt4 n=1 Tax=Thermofilum pendens TaxID=2269 RepID=A0A7C4H0L8_THEPE
MSKRKLPLKACVKCRFLVEEDVETCPSCGSREFTDNWEGLIVVLNEQSVAAKVLGIQRKGFYALKAR